MFASAWTILWLISVVAAATLQLTAPGSGLMAVFAGLWLVVGGTVLMARIGNSSAGLMSLGHCLKGTGSPRSTVGTRESELKWFLEAASLFRYGNIRPAEAATQRISDPFLRRGTQLVLDGFPREQVKIALQRQIADDRDHFRRPVDLLHTMSGYAPHPRHAGHTAGLGTNVIWFERRGSGHRGRIHGFRHADDRLWFDIGESRIQASCQQIRASRA